MDFLATDLFGDSQVTDEFFEIDMDEAIQLLGQPDLEIHNFFSDGERVVLPETATDSPNSSTLPVLEALR